MESDLEKGFQPGSGDGVLDDMERHEKVPGMKLSKSRARYQDLVHVDLFPHRADGLWRASVRFSEKGTIRTLPKKGTTNMTCVAFGHDEKEQELNRSRVKERRNEESFGGFVAFCVR